VVYDLHNGGSQVINGYGGVLADFDVVATDRLHDVAYTDAGRLPPSCATSCHGTAGAGSNF
jgi:hypothetical protein